MELGAADATAEGCPDRDLGVEAATRALPVLAELGSDLVEALGGEAQELNLGDGHHPGDRQSERGADDACLGQRRVDYPLVAVLLDQTGRRAEDAAQPSDVKPECHDAVVPAHLLIERVVDRLDDVPGSHCLWLPSRNPVRWRSRPGKMLSKSICGLTGPCCSAHPITRSSSSLI